MAPNTTFAFLCFLSQRFRNSTPVVCFRIIVTMATMTVQAIGPWKAGFPLIVKKTFSILFQYRFNAEWKIFSIASPLFVFPNFQSWSTLQKAPAKLSLAVKNKIWINKWLNLELFQYFTYILAKFHTDSRSWKSVSQFNTFNTAWEPCKRFSTNYHFTSSCRNVRNIARSSRERRSLRWGGLAEHEEGEAAVEEGVAELREAFVTGRLMFQDLQQLQRGEAGDDGRGGGYGRDDVAWNGTNETVCREGVWTVAILGVASNFLVQKLLTLIVWTLTRFLQNFECKLP